MEYEPKVSEKCGLSQQLSFQMPSADFSIDSTERLNFPCDAFNVKVIGNSGLSLFGVDTGWSRGDGFEVEFAAGQVDHGAEIVHVPETTGAGLHVLDDAVQAFEDRVRVRVVEVGEDVPPVPAQLPGEGLHGFQPRMHHPRAQRPEPGLRLHAAGAAGIDVLQAFAHSARPGGLQPLFRQVPLDLQLRIRQACLVPEPHVLRVPQYRPVPRLGLADLVDGLVGVLDDMVSFVK